MAHDRLNPGLFARDVISTYVVSGPVSPSWEASLWEDEARLTFQM